MIRSNCSLNLTWARISGCCDGRNRAKKVIRDEMRLAANRVPCGLKPQSRPALLTRTRSEQLHTFHLATMAPKNKPGDKGKGKEAAAEKSGGKQKGAQRFAARSPQELKHA